VGGAAREYDQLKEREYEYLTQWRLEVFLAYWMWRVH
jgi:hypothetical protein